MENETNILETGVLPTGTYRTTAQPTDAHGILILTPEQLTEIRRRFA